MIAPVLETNFSIFTMNSNLYCGSISTKEIAEAEIVKQDYGTWLFPDPTEAQLRGWEVAYVIILVFVLP